MSRPLSRPYSAALGAADAPPPAAVSRAEWMDALRGFALLGILLYNVEVFSGVVFSGLMPDLDPIGAAFDPALQFVAHWLIQGKFYSLFSFLFGLGIALQLQNAQASGGQGLRLVRRRLGWLFAFGLAHAFLIWFGDILTVYALLGFGLLLARHLSARALLFLAIAFLASPVPIYLAFMAFGVNDPLAGEPGQPPSESIVGKAVQTIRDGRYLDLVQAHAWFYPGGWVRRSLQLALPRIFGMFLLGVWAARVGLPRLGAAEKLLLRKWLGFGLAFGLPLSLALALAGGNQAMYPVGLQGLVVVVLASTSIPLLCLGYIAAFGIFWRSSQSQGLLVSAGRTSLSQYLGQSMVCVWLFYGYGLGLFGQLGYGLAMLVAVGVFLALGLAARLWLRHFPQGPLEMLWRRLAGAGYSGGGMH